MAALVLFILLAVVSKTDSAKYLVPAIRNMVFLGGWADYVSRSPALPKAPIIRIRPAYLGNEFIEQVQRDAIQLLHGTSVSHMLGGAVAEPSDFGRFEAVAAVREKLKEEALPKYRPFGMQQYLAGHDRTRRSRP
jgi:hypothetical protein